MSGNNSDCFYGGFFVGTVMTCFVGGATLLDSVDKVIIVNDVVSKESIRSLIESGVATKEDFKAAAQKGINDLAAVASQQFPSTVNGLPVDTHVLTRQAVEDYLAGDKSKPPVITAPAAAPAIPAP